MKIIEENDLLFEMANVNPLKSGIPVIVWSDHGGVLRNTGHNVPRVKVGKDDFWVVVSIEESPQILSQSGNIKKSEMVQIDKGIKYVGRNYKTFLKHFNDTDFEFDDEDMFNELRSNGQYK